MSPAATHIKEKGSLGLNPADQIMAGREREREREREMRRFAQSCITFINKIRNNHVQQDCRGCSNAPINNYCND